MGCRIFVFFGYPCLELLARLWCEDAFTFVSHFAQVLCFEHVLFVPWTNWTSKHMLFSLLAMMVKTYISLPEEKCFSVFAWYFVLGGSEDPLSIQCLLVASCLLGFFHAYAGNSPTVIGLCRGTTTEMRKKVDVPVQSQSAFGPQGI